MQLVIFIFGFYNVLPINNRLSTKLLLQLLVLFFNELSAILDLFHLLL